MLRAVWNSLNTESKIEGVFVEDFVSVDDNIKTSEALDES